jgi:DNA-binding transcriptional regulator YiaG
LKQVELAKILGVSEDLMRNWEKGRTHPSEENLRQIEGVFEKNY